MSDDMQSALPGAQANGLVQLRESGLQGMVSIRADLMDDAVIVALKDALQGDLPAPRQIVTAGDTRIAWMSPDEILVLCDYAAADRLVATITTGLASLHHLVVNVSDARAVFELQGENNVLRDVVPADMAQSALAPGHLRRTRVAQVPAAIWFEHGQSLRVICFRSVAQYVFDVLALSAQSGGDVGYY